MADELWTNTTGAPLYITNETPPRVVPQQDPKAAFLLVAMDGVIPLAQAIALGLVPQDEPKAKPTPANKAKQ